MIHLLLSMVFHYYLSSIIYIALTLTLLVYYTHSQMLLLFHLVLCMCMYLPLDNSLCYMFTPPYLSHSTYYVLYMHSMSYLLLYLHFLLHLYSISNMFHSLLLASLHSSLLYLLLLYMHYPLDYYLFTNSISLFILHHFMLMLLSDFMSSMCLLYLFHIPVSSDHLHSL